MGRDGKGKDAKGMEEKESERAGWGGNGREGVGKRGNVYKKQERDPIVKTI